MPQAQEVELPDSFFDQVLELRGLSMISIDLSSYFRESKRYKDITQDFRDYITKTIQQRPGWQVKPFGQRNLL